MTRPAVTEHPVVLDDLEVYSGMPARTHVVDDYLAVREPQHDLDGQDEWRLMTACVAGECSHPMHGLGRPHGRAHLTWLWATEPTPRPLEPEPLR